MRHPEYIEGREATENFEEGMIKQRQCPARSWKLEERHSGSFYAASC